MPVGRAVSGALALVSVIRRGKAVHPRGVVHAATVRVPGAAAAPRAAQLFAEPGEYRAVVRFSRSLGLPRPLPDLLGMAIRVLDAYGSGRHQDLLLITSMDLPLAHHLFLPAAGLQDRIYSSSLPYRAGDERFIVGALPRGEAANGDLRFDLAVASLEGRFRRVAELDVGARLGPELDAMAFNPFNCGGGMRPSGRLNRWRAVAYPRSQAARRHTSHDRIVSIG